MEITIKNTNTIVLILNLVTLILVGYQAYLNRKSLKEMRLSMQLNMKERYLVNLPKADFIIFIRIKLKRWKNDLIQIEKLMKKSRKKIHPDLITVTLEKKINTPKGLIHKFYYEKSPQWLSNIYIAGAQYYYDCMAPITYMCNKQNPNNIHKSLISRFNNSIKYMSELLLLIDDIIPEVYLESPAKLSDKDFYE